MKQITVIYSGGLSRIFRQINETDQLVHRLGSDCFGDMYLKIIRNGKLSEMLYVDDGIEKIIITDDKSPLNRHEITIPKH